MKTYSISEAARVLGIHLRTLQRWIRDKEIPVPKPGIISGRLVKFWTEKEMEKLREHKEATYWGKGIDRRTGKKAKKSSQR